MRLKINIFGFVLVCLAVFLNFSIILTQEFNPPPAECYADTTTDFIGYTHLQFPLMPTVYEYPDLESVTLYDAANLIPQVATILREPYCNQSYIWWLLEFEDGLTGWVVENPYAYTITPLNPSASAAEIIATSTTQASDRLFNTPQEPDFDTYYFAPTSGYEQGYSETAEQLSSGRYGSGFVLMVEENIPVWVILDTDTDLGEVRLFRYNYETPQDPVPFETLTDTGLDAKYVYYIPSFPFIEDNASYAFIFTAGLEAFEFSVSIVTEDPLSGDETVVENETAAESLTTVSSPPDGMIFEDDFSDNSNVWYESANGTVNNNSYTLRFDTAADPLRFFTFPFTDIPLELEIDEPYNFSFDILDGECSSRCALRIFFNIRANTDNIYIYNYIDYYPVAAFGRDRGQATLFGFLNDDPNRFREYRDDREAGQVAVFDGNRHTIKLSVEEGITTLYIDDQLISSFNVPLDLFGKVGFGLSRIDEQATAQLAFDDVRISTVTSEQTIVAGVDSSIFTDVATSLNFGVSVPTPPDWNSGNQNPFTFLVVYQPDNPEDEFGIQFAFNTRLMTGISNEQEFARTFFGSSGNTRVGEFTFIEVDGARLLRADLIVDETLIGAVAVKQIQDNYFLGMTAFAYSAELWREKENLVYTMIANTRPATAAELNQGLDSVPVEGTFTSQVSIGGFQVGLPADANVSTDVIDLVGALSGIGTPYSITTSELNELQGINRLRFWEFRGGFSNYLNAVQVAQTYALSTTDLSWEYINLNGQPTLVMRIAGAPNVYGLFGRAESGESFAIVLEAQSSISDTARQLVQKITASTHKN